MSEDEKYVRAHWEAGITAGKDVYGYGITLPSRPRRLLIGYEKKSSAWAAAAEFTLERLKEMGQLREEIALMTVVIDDAYRNCGVEGCGCDNPWKRTRGRLQHLLADLKRGMKPAT